MPTAWQRAARHGKPLGRCGDTHWLRADIDHFIVQQAVAKDIPYLDRTTLDHLEQGPRWHLAGEREGEPIELTAAFIIDATGPAGRWRVR